MGYSLARVFAAQGARVDLVSGPVGEKAGHPDITVYPVVSASEMFEQTKVLFPGSDISIFAAAVADFTPAEPKPHKIKRTGLGHMLELKPVVDIAAAMGGMKRAGQVLAGFALETDEGEDSAIRKMKSKNLDMIVLNSLKNKGSGFGTDTNRVTIFRKGNKRKDFELKAKDEVAEDIADEVFNLLNEIPDA